MNWFKKKEEVKTREKIFIVECGLNCPRDSRKCPKYIEFLNHTKTESGEIKTTSEGRCAIAWLPTLLIELNQTIQKVIQNGSKT
jgi:hypothetical protein